MPILGYEVYNYNHYLSRVLVKYMQVSEHTYFSYALPAISLFVFAMTLPIKSEQTTDMGAAIMKQFARIRQINNRNPKPGIVIVCTGIVMLFVSRLLPSSLRFVGDLFYFSSFAAILYVYHSDNRKLKIILIPLFVGVLLVSALNSAMFTVIAYMGATVYSFFLIGSKASLFKKITIFLAGVVFILVLQNAKSIYRTYVMQKQYSGNKAELFAGILYDQFTRGDALIEKDAFFFVFIRMNQGWNISNVLKKIPSQREYENGRQLLRVAFASVIPRLFWADKPEAGGKFNMQYYAGLKIEGWSTNIGPLGEAYGNFGVGGGIIYMFLLGLFIRWIYKKVFKLGIKTPLLILWLPVLFYQVTYSAETDTLQILNSLFKTSFFIYLIYRFLPSWFGKQKTGVSKPVLPMRNTIAANN